LGELHLCNSRLKKKRLPFRDRAIYDGGVYFLEESYLKYGLITYEGAIKGSNKTLSSLNDEGDMSWPEIAKFIRKNPEKVFTISV
jgi:hypothetical protein